MTGEYLEYTKWKMNAYSLALGIPENTNFASIHEWLEYILGRTAKVTVTQKGNYLNITKVEPLEQVYRGRFSILKIYDKEDMLVFEGELLEGRNILELHYSQMYALRDNSQPHLPQNAKYPKVICNGVTFTKLELYEVGYTLTIKGEVYEVTKIEKIR